MQTAFSLNNIETLKRELGVLLPDVKSSHRVEAIARALGWQTNAALRATLSGAAVAKDVDDRMFVDYLKSHGFDVPLGTLAEAIVRTMFSLDRSAVQGVLEHEPRLTRWGFGLCRDSTQTRQQKRST